jgi:hypothetical protein
LPRRSVATIIELNGAVWYQLQASSDMVLNKNKPEKEDQHQSLFHLFHHEVRCLAGVGFPTKRASSVLSV